MNNNSRENKNQENIFLGKNLKENNL